MKQEQMIFRLFLFTIPVNFVFDYLYYFGGSQSLTSVLRIGWNLFIILHCLLTQKKLQAPRNNLLYFLLSYWAVLILFSSNISASVIEYLKVAVSLMFFPIAATLINSHDRFVKFHRYTLYCLVVYAFFVFLSNMFGIGDISYESEDDDVFKTGLGDAKLYPPAFLVGLIPFYLRQKIVTRKIFWIIIAFINFSLLLLSLRRTTLIIIALLISLFFLFAGHIGKLFKVLALAAILLAVTFPLYEEALTKRLEIRSNVYSEEYTVTQEGRYMELGYVLNDFEQNRYAPVPHLLGKEAFNTIDNYGFYKPRPIHVDYTYIFFSSGLLGLILYLVFVFRIRKMAVFYRSKIKKLVPKDYFAAFHALFIVFLLVGLSGNVWAMTYRMYIFSVMGSFIGYFRMHYQETLYQEQALPFPHTTNTFLDKYRLSL
ncbi:hypothetical protein [Parasegetibacter sp. NRK P23]|uniref:hypothetical protein n=1 Tax=Parasegetibacter sp. NRK P23 TaxID=2942999 RepID=UPI0020445218|nr:hypothetical protein [Parasegetibacter sp. NRK P23]MCM5530070.1 hypothetical protein [Parasegetibacter sp. NRK P23]